jgi:hypothetical protein
MQYVTDGKQKYIWLPRANQEQFFDLTADPGECRNLIAEPAWRQRVAIWRQRLIDELASRQCGWCRDGQLNCPDEPLVSPWKTARWTGS